MSAAKHGHAALNATADLADGVPTDETRGRFIHAALGHAEDQLTLAQHQYDAVAAKCDQMIDCWRAKTDEALAIRDRAITELARWAALLAALLDQYEEG